MRKQEHNYELRGYKFGFRIIPKDEKRPIIYVKLEKSGFWNIKNHGGHIPLYSFYMLLDSCIAIIYETWTLPKKTKSAGANHKMTQWAKMNTKKTLAKKMRDIWKNCCNNLDPDIEELHRKLYSVSNGTGYWERIEQICDNKKKYRFLIKDMLKYPSARVAILHGILSKNGENYPLMYEWSTDWMREYAHDGKIYTSLKKTLMNLPRGVTYYYYLCLGNIKLPEPVTSRIRMFAYTTLARMRFNDEEKKERMKVIVRSNDEQLKEAVRYMWKYFPLHGNDNFRRNGSIVHSFHMIFDYPFDIGKWDIMGLTKRSEEYHHDLDMQARAERMRREKENEKLFASKTMLPAIPLPKTEHIKFLDSYKAVQDEGELMGHCIAQYAKSAVEGYCYLFHIDYDGEMASVEVSPSGYVVQSYGPRDTKNKASEYGKRELGKWARELCENKPKQETIKVGESTDEFGNIWEEHMLTVPTRIDLEAIPF